MESWLTSSVRDRESDLSWDDMGCMELSSSCCTEYSYRLETAVSGNLCRFLKEVKPLVLYAVEHRIDKEPMQGKWASSQVDFGYTELFCIPEVTAGFLSSCDSFLGDSLVFHQAHRGSLRD